MDPLPRTPFLVERMRGFGTTIFAEMTALAQRTGAINLGQGFPDTDGPTSVLDAAVDAIRSGRNQYPPGAGVPELREAIAEHQERFYGLAVDPATQVLVTAGATEAIATTLLALVEPGDEVVVFEPYYDSYAASVALAGGVRRTVVLRAPDFAMDEAALRAAFSDRTRVVLLNTPHNPTGKVLTAAELAVLADVAQAADLLVLTDEVYEHLVFPGAEHVSPATLPGMRERTLVVSSGGKTFNTTGWKIGWVCGPAPLVAAVRTAKQFLTYVNGGPFQPAIAAGLRLPDEYFRHVAHALGQHRDLLVIGLAEAGLPVISPQATYFATVDVRPVQPDGDGWAFCRTLPERAGVVAVPTEVFYAPEHAAMGRHLVRFAFCKREEVLGEAVARLRRMA
jgi:N-succinyldiaminopimelate aminotransferase